MNPLLALLLVVPACGGRTTTPEAPAPDPAGSGEELPPPERTAEGSVEDPALEAAGHTVGDPYTVEGEPTLEGTRLTAPVAYGGGCETHTWTPRLRHWTTEAGGTAIVDLVHDGHGDTCRKRVTETITANLGTVFADADCTRHVAIHPWRAPDAGGPAAGPWTLPLVPPHGCD